VAQLLKLTEHKSREKRVILLQLLLTPLYTKRAKDKEKAGRSWQEGEGSSKVRKGTEHPEILFEQSHWLKIFEPGRVPKGFFPCSGLDFAT
jgi:hypothetical protein